MDLAMKRSITRRQALRGAAALIPAGIVRAQDPVPIRVAAKPVEVAITTVSPITVRIQIYSFENSKPQTGPSDGALIKEDWGQPLTRPDTVGAPRVFKSGDLSVKLTSAPLAIQVEDKKGRRIQDLRFDSETGKLTFAAGTAPLLGLGQGGPQFSRNGSADRNLSGQGGYRLATNGARVPVQLLIGTDGWAMFVHQPLGVFDLTATDGTGAFAASTGQSPLPVDIFVIGTADPIAIMAEYARLTGHPEMAPLWSFGYQQSHRTLGPPEEISQEAKTFREKKLPCDAMIYLGTEFCPNGWNTRNGEFTWNARAFPDPKAAIQELHDEHFKVVLHIVTEGRHFEGTVHDPCTAAPLPPGRIPGNGYPPDRQVSCYWPAHKPLLDLGVDGWWPDQGDGLRRRLAPCAQSHVLRRPADVPPERARLCAASQRVRRHAALCRVPVVGRRSVAVGDAQDARSDRHQHRAERHSVLGHRHRRFRSDAGIYRRALRSLVPVRGVLSALPVARPRLAPASAVGLEYADRWPFPARLAKRPVTTPTPPSFTTPPSSPSARSTWSCATS